MKSVVFWRDGQPVVKPWGDDQRIVHVRKNPFTRDKPPAPPEKYIEMNPDTLVTVHGYAGDLNQVRWHLPFYEHHKCPVVIFSPENSKIEKMGPHICRFGGVRAYVGPESLERQKIHMQMMLEYPHEFFLANDSDSFCLSPKIPDYVYEEPDVLWSNEVSDMMHKRPDTYALPRLAFQPPYFFSRSVLERLLSVADDNIPDPQTPFIDHYMMQLAVASECPHKNYRDGISCPSTDPHSLSVMRDHVRNHGKIMVHSVKDNRVRKFLGADRDLYLRTKARHAAR